MTQELSSIALIPSPDGSRYRLECRACGAFVDVKVAGPGLVETTMYHEPGCPAVFAAAVAAGGVQ